MLEDSVQLPVTGELHKQSVFVHLLKHHIVFHFGSCQFRDMQVLMKKCLKLVDQGSWIWRESGILKRSFLGSDWGQFLREDEGYFQRISQS